MKTLHIWALAAVLALAVSGCKEERENVKAAPLPQPTTQQPQSTPLPQAAQVLRAGTFRGVSNYRAQGEIRIVRAGGVTKIILPQNFSVSGVPDPKLGFGNNGYKAGSLFAKLNRNSGTQEYIVPANVDLSKFNEVWIWCERFSVAIAVAKLN
jgi:hypothetical protein